MSVRRPSSERVLTGTIFASVALHVLFMVVLPRYDHVRPEDEELAPIEIEMDVRTVEAEVEAAPTPVVPAPGTLTQPVAENRPSDVRTPEITPTPSATPQTAEPTVLTVDHNPATSDQAAPVAPGVRLDPRAVALSTSGTGPVALAPQAQAGPGETTRERDARLGQELGAHLRERANFQEHLTTRPDPQPRTLPDGRVAFEGVGLTMIFDPRDGSTAFNDRPGFSYEGFGSSASGRDGLTFSFDLNDGMHRRHGSDPRQAERRWLLRRTEDFRNNAQDAARETQASTAARSVRGRLQRLLDDTTRPIEARRASMFRLWDGCSEDDIGEATRRSIIAFIRERMPQGSETGFTSGEIAAMNGRRQSTAPFAPY